MLCHLQIVLGHTLDHLVNKIFKKVFNINSFLFSGKTGCFLLFGKSVENGNSSKGIFGNGRAKKTQKTQNYEMRKYVLYSKFEYRTEIIDLHTIEK